MGPQPSKLLHRAQATLLWPPMTGLWVCGQLLSKSYKQLKQLYSALSNASRLTKLQRNSQRTITMPHTSEVSSANGVLSIDPKTLVEGQVHYEVKDGVLLLTRVSDTGCGTHTRFIHGVPGIPTPASSGNAPRATNVQVEQVQAPRTSNPDHRRYRESKGNGVSLPDTSPNRPPPSSSTNDEDTEMAQAPATPRARRTANGGPTTPGGRPLMRSPPVVLDSPSLGERAEAWIAQNINGNDFASHHPLRLKARTGGPSADGTWDNVLESLPLTKTRVERRRKMEYDIVDREFRNLEIEHDLTWNTMEHDVRAMEGVESDDSDFDESEYASSAYGEEAMVYGASEQMVEDQLRTQSQSQADSDMEDLYVDTDSEHHSSAGGTPHASFTSNNSSSTSIFRDQYGTFYQSFNPLPAPISEDVEAEGDNHSEVQRAIAAQGEDFYKLSTSDLSTASSESEYRFRGFQSRTCASTSGSARSSRSPANLMRYVTPDNAGLTGAREVPPAPTRVRIRNPTPFDQQTTSLESSMFEPTPGLTPRQAEKYLPQQELVGVRDASGGPDRRKKAVRWRDPTPLPSREVTPAAGPSTAPLMSPRAVIHEEKRKELQRKLYGSRAPELRKRKVLLRPAAEVLAESEASTYIDTDANNTPNASGVNIRTTPTYLSEVPVAGSSGVGRADSLKENVKPLSSLSPGRVPLQTIHHQSFSAEAPVLTPVNVVPISIRDASPKTPGPRTRGRVSDVATSPMLTRSRAKAAGQVQTTTTPRSSGKGKGRA
ncbi:hypothetical protein SCHPADRAFT_525187 [Schizopora paradoxa]|uniref:Uncharacterized protein n=1 Tax=Schizopora paradoxa TaxID=27342 RepID=A0A0H2RLL4_9AGAM|nr:hypothetical protein SCHPADRAFT_525187 [Schizopora paradoxa]